MDLLSYDPTTGVFRWLVSRRSGVKAGSIAGSYNDQGYRRIKIDGKHYRENRLAWLIMTGKWPEHEVDHVNGVRDDNRWVNLRHATRGQNEVNKPAYNSLGVKGVRKIGERYQARLGGGAKRINLGWYSCEEDAMKAYQNAAQNKYGNFVRE